MGQLIQLSKTSTGAATNLDMELSFPIGHKRIRLESASAHPVDVADVVYARLGYTFKYGPGLNETGRIDFNHGLARRGHPLTLNYPRELIGPGKLYAAILVEFNNVANTFTFAVAYEVL